MERGRSFPTLSLLPAPCEVRTLWRCPRLKSAASPADAQWAPHRRLSTGTSSIHTWLVRRWGAVTSRACRASLLQWLAHVVECGVGKRARFLPAHIKINVVCETMSGCETACEGVRGVRRARAPRARWFDQHLHVDRPRLISTEAVRTLCAPAKGLERFLLLVAVRVLWNHRPARLHPCRRDPRQRRPARHGGCEAASSCYELAVTL